MSAVVVVVVVTLGCEMSPPKLSLPLGVFGPPTETWFVGSTRVHILNGISIDSDVLAQLTVTNRHADHTNTHTHPFNDPFSGTTRVSQYQKGEINLDFTEARDSEWQWNELGHMRLHLAPDR